MARRRRYKRTFQFFDTEQEAKEFCDKVNTNRYVRIHCPAGYYPWTSNDGIEHKFIAWYSEK